jgi:glycosyltransferase Alg8
MIPVPVRRFTWQAAVSGVLTFLTFFILSWFFTQQVPLRIAADLSQSVIALSTIGMLRYGWFWVNYLRGMFYLHVRFPRLRRLERQLTHRYPTRLFIVVASYMEDPDVSKRTIPALFRELADFPSQVTVLFSVGGKAEIDLIRRLAVSVGLQPQHKVVFMLQAHGKRMALGASLRTVAREYYQILSWHEDACNDLVVLMDGDSELAPGALHDSVGFFRAMPALGALTTDEVADFLVKDRLMRDWFGLKFAWRHIKMSSHALSERVLTLTGRFSIFRADAILSEKSIRSIEMDILDHWLFGRFRFLMGDDKSTWFDLLSNRWNMLYIPDVHIRAIESRTGDFLKTSISLMFRWYGNVARNNWRALRLGPARMPMFIWLSIVDQRLSMWATLIGPVSAILIAANTSIHAITLYIAWVFLTRGVQLALLIPLGHVLNPLHFVLQMYNQWIGSFLKILALFFMHRQHWAKNGAAAQMQSGLGARQTAMIWFRFVFALIVYVMFVMGMTSVIRMPAHMHLLAGIRADNVAAVRVEQE